jgi:hypothetical protein
MATTGIHCRVFEGLCNRINCLASALATGRPVYLRWAVNRQCPLEFERVIRANPNTVREGDRHNLLRRLRKLEPVPDVKVVNEPVEEYSYEANPRRICWYFPRNVDGLPPDVFRERLFGAYRQILERLAVRGYVIPPPPAIGLVFRRFHPHTDAFDHFWKSVETAVSALRPQTVFVASDSDEHKRELLRRLDDLGVATAANDCPLLTSDLARPAENVLGMCRDLLSLAHCRVGVIASSSVSTVPDSLRGMGVRVYYTHRSADFRFHGDDDAFEFHGVQELLADHHLGTTNTQPLCVPVASRL